MASLPAAELEDSTTVPLPPLRSLLSTSTLVSSSSSSSSSSSPSSPSSSYLLLSSSSRSSTSSSSPSSSSPLWQRRSNISGQGRRNKTSLAAQDRRLPKPFSEPSMFTMEDLRDVDADSEKGLASPSGYRRCMTDTDFKSVHGWPSQPAPDLLQLFNIFQFNKPEKPPARMLINVTLVGNIHPVRLLVAYDASVQDVIKASLKAYVKEGRLPRHCFKNDTYGLHYSPFCLENIDPTEHICSLGTRSFFLFPSVSPHTRPLENSNETRPWWKIFGLMLT